MNAAQKTALIHRRLYRALLKAAKPFTPPSPNAAVLRSLLHRSFVPLEVDEAVARQRLHDIRSSSSSSSSSNSSGVSSLSSSSSDQQHSEEDYTSSALNEFYVEFDFDEEGDSDDEHYQLERDDYDDAEIPTRYDDHFLLFRRLLWMLFSEGWTYSPNQMNAPTRSHNYKSKVVPCFQFPEHVHRQPFKLRECIRQEFRVPDVFAEEKGNDDGVNNHHRHDKRKGRFGGYFSSAFPAKARREAAFLTLRKLNEKLVWADQLLFEKEKKKQQQRQKNQVWADHMLQQNQRQKQKTQKSMKHQGEHTSNLCKQAAKHVEPLPIPASTKQDFSKFLTPGTYLLAHPNMGGYFRRSVICILHHGIDIRDAASASSTATTQDGEDDDDDNSKDDSDEDNDKKGAPRKEKGEEEFGTLGVIVNRVSLTDRMNARTISDVIPFLPKDLQAALGGLPMKEGGPVHMPSIQMLHTSSPTITMAAANVIKAIKLANPETVASTSASTSNGNTPSKQGSAVGQLQSAEDDDDGSDDECVHVLEEIGGTKLPRVHLDREDEKEVSYRGDIFEAARAVKSGYLDRGNYWRQLAHSSLCS